MLGPLSSVSLHRVVPMSGTDENAIWNRLAANCLPVGFYGRESRWFGALRLGLAAALSGGPSLPHSEGPHLLAEVGTVDQRLDLLAIVA